MEGMKWPSSGMLGVLPASNLGFGLALAEICQTFGQRQCQEGMTCPNSAPHSLHKHGNITQWTHMEEMKWPCNGMLGGLAANNLGLGLALAEICQTFGQR